MRIGVNWIAPKTLAIIRELHQLGEISFCEIMVDNVAHLPPEKILHALGDIPVCLHIITSRFLSCSPQALRELAKQLQAWIKALNPFYVSDHIIDFSQTIISEFDYEKNYTHIKNRVIEWQDLLDTKILFENHASITLRGKQQAQFFTSLLNDTDAGLLFDFSNAYIAELNSVAPFNDWYELITKTQHFHVGGYRIDAASGLALDTHDQPIAENVIALMQPYLEKNPQATLVMENNASVTLDVWQKEIARVKTSQHTKNINSQKVKPADAKTQALLGQQNLTHKIFHTTPKLKALLDKHYSSVLNEFISATSAEDSWLQHMYFLHWLMEQEVWRKRIDLAIIRELMLASVTRWSLQGLDHVAAKGVLLFSRYSPDVAMGLWKSREPGHPGKAVLVNLVENQHPDMDSYGISYQFGSWQNIEWRALPQQVALPA